MELLNFRALLLAFTLLVSVTTVAGQEACYHPGRTLKLKAPENATAASCEFSIFNPASSEILQRWSDNGCIKGQKFLQISLPNDAPACPSCILSAKLTMTLASGISLKKDNIYKVCIENPRNKAKSDSSEKIAGQNNQAPREKAPEVAKVPEVAINAISPPKVEPTKPEVKNFEDKKSITTSGSSSAQTAAQALGLSPAPQVAINVISPPKVETTKPEVKIVEDKKSITTSGSSSAQTAAQAPGLSPAPQVAINVISPPKVETNTKDIKFDQDKKSNITSGSSSAQTAAQAPGLFPAPQVVVDPIPPPKVDTNTKDIKTGQVTQSEAIQDRFKSLFGNLGLNTASKTSSAGPSSRQESVYSKSKSTHRKGKY